MIFYIGLKLNIVIVEFEFEKENGDEYVLK